MCTNSWVCLFGELADGAVSLNAFGEIVADEWLRTALVRDNVSLDAFVIMPNHLHGIIVITHHKVVAPTLRRGDPAGRPYMPKRSHGPASGSIGAITSQFKSRSTKRINASRGTPSTPVWQRNYYEHVVRDEDELNAIRQYIVDNPASWEADDSNPNRTRRGDPAGRPYSPQS